MFKIDVDNINGKTESLYVFGKQSILTELEDNQIILNHSCRQGLFKGNSDEVLAYLSQSSKD
jgi:ferredoxin